MKRAYLFSGLAVSALAVLGWQCGSSDPAAEALSTRQVELTVYSQDFAQVTEVRTVDLVEGVVRIALGDVSHSLDQSTVLYDWPQGSEAQVTSTTYDLGTQEGQSLLDQLVGRTVTLVYRSETGRATSRETGVLEASSPGNVVVRVGDRLVINPDATIEAPAGEVATMPKLTASVENGKDESQALTLSYLTRGLSWSADYVMTLDEETSELECWATVTNHTGIDFPAAKIKFVAGAPNRAVVDTDTTYGRPALAAEDMYEMKSRRLGDGGAGEPVYYGELVAYPYESNATLRNNQTSRVLMMKEPKVKVTRDYAIRLPSPGWYGYRDATERLKATLSLALKNSEEAGLGAPLPMGRVRVYDPSDEGAPVLIGAASIGNTPKDDRIDMTLTEVFNVYARGKLVATRKIDRRKTAYDYEITVYNEKEKATDVRLVSNFYGAWTIQKESSKSTRPDASSAQWVVNAPSGGETKLTYTVVVG